MFFFLPQLKKTKGHPNPITYPWEKNGHFFHPNPKHQKNPGRAIGPSKKSGYHFDDESEDEVGYLEDRPI